ncbi:MAG: M20/M25/M40 family metallo-hydrolase [Rhodospirillales bacterium]
MSPNDQKDAHKDAHKNSGAAIVRSNALPLDGDEILKGIVEWVNIESPSHDPAAVNRMVDRVEHDMAAIGAELQRTPGKDGFGDVLIARTPWGEMPGILVLSHVDTVHPVGLLEGALKVRREGDAIFGPGIYDMKGGAYLAYYAYRHLVRLGRQTKLKITFMFVPDEEVGSNSCRDIIEAEAVKHKYALVMEPARDGGKIVTARKGVGHFTIKATGRPSHSGVRPQDGRSAIKEMARQIVDIEAMTDFPRAITLNVGTIKGGTGTNVVPQFCEATIDLRVPDKVLGEEMVARIHGLKPYDPDVKLEISGGMNRPAFTKNAGIAALYEHAKGVAKDLGFDLIDVPMTGGGSDGNFTAALGIPTLDGLGPDGKGAHTDYEQIYFSSLEERTRLMLRMFETLE